MLISIPCPDDGSYRLIRFVVTLASWKAHIQKCLHPCFFGLIDCPLFYLFYTAWLFINIYQMLVNHLMWFVFSIFPVCPVALSNSCEIKQNSFQLSSISMSVLDLYLLCMTLVPWIDKNFIFNLQERAWLVVFVSLRYMCSISRFLLVFVCPSHDTRTVKWQKLCNHVLAHCQNQGSQNSEHVIHP